MENNNIIEVLKEYLTNEANMFATNHIDAIQQFLSSKGFTLTEKELKELTLNTDLHAFICDHYRQIDRTYYLNKVIDFLISKGFTEGNEAVEYFKTMENPFFKNAYKSELIYDFVKQGVDNPAAKFKPKSKGLKTMNEDFILKIINLNYQLMYAFNSYRFTNFKNNGFLTTAKEKFEAIKTVYEANKPLLKKVDGHTLAQIQYLNAFLSNNAHYLSVEGLNDADKKFIEDVLALNYSITALMKKFNYNDLIANAEYLIPLLRDFEPTIN